MSNRKSCKGSPKSSNPQAQKLFPECPWPLDSDESPLQTCRPQPNPGLDSSHKSCGSKTTPLGSQMKAHTSKPSDEPASLAFNSGQVVADSPPKTAISKHGPRRKRRLQFSMKGVYFLLRRSSRSLCCNTLFWLWRKWRTLRFPLWKPKTVTQAKVSRLLLRLSCCPCPSPNPNNKQKVIRALSRQHPKPCSRHKKGGNIKHLHFSAAYKALLQRYKEKLSHQQENLENRLECKPGASEARNSQGGSDHILGNETSPLVGFESIKLCSAADLPAKQTKDGNVTLGITDKEIEAVTVVSSRHEEDPSGQTVNETGCDLEPRATACPTQDLGANREKSLGSSNKNELKNIRPRPSQPQSPVSCTALIKHEHEFLDGFCRKYGSLIPVQDKDVQRHLKKTLNLARKDLIFPEAQRPTPAFQVVYKKHTLTLDDMSTLEDQNWINDQVINMYGELITASSQNKVYMFNSFFHQQLVTKGFEGVRRWTRQVPLFTKSFLLIPVHMEEIHWCLVVADTAQKRVQLYDSQGHIFKEVAKKILGYLLAEAKSRQQPEFQTGWTWSVKQEIPQQTNENDCGVFVLEYCRCLALGKPLHFSQLDIPRIRQRIYKELFDSKLL